MSLRPHERHGWARIAFVLLLGLGLICTVNTAAAALTPPAGPPPVTGTTDTIKAHLAAMAAYSAPFAAQQLDLVFAQSDAPAGKLLKLHWQQGQFRIERNWLGISEVYGYDGQDYWYGSSEQLPFSLDHTLGSDVTHQFIPNLYYTAPGQAAAIRPLTDHELSEAHKLPQLNGYLLLDYYPPGMSDSWLLLDPATLLLKGSLLGDGRLLDTSSLLQASFYSAWADYGVARYPADIRIVDIASDGTEVRDRTLHVQSITAGAALAPEQFKVGSSPAVPQPTLPGGQLTVPFRIVDDGITLDAMGPDGKPLVFKYDSGANIGLLRRTTALRLGLAPEGSEPVTGHGGSVLLQFAQVKGVRLGAAEVPPFEIAVTGDAAAGAPQPGSPGYDYYVARLGGDPHPSLDSAFHEDGVDGLLGTSLLNNYIVRIDYARRELTLFDTATFAPTKLSATAQALPLTRDAMPFTPVTVDGKLHGGAFFNTGARAYFSLATWALDREKITYPVLDIASGLSIHGPQVFGIVKPGLVELGTLKLAHPTTYLEMLAPGDTPDESRIASFGSEFFHEHVVTFDLFHEKVYVE